MRKDIHYLYDGQGKLAAVQIPANLWRRLESLLPQEAQQTAPDNDMDAFAEFMAAWDFRYAYEPVVQCPHCHAQTQDWRKDAAFALKNANLGGLLVFACANCGAIVRQKFFKDHVACEFTPPAP